MADSLGILDRARAVGIDWLIAESGKVRFSPKLSEANASQRAIIAEIQADREAIAEILLSREPEGFGSMTSTAVESSPPTTVDLSAVDLSADPTTTTTTTPIVVRTVRELLKTYPTLRPPVIHGLLREGETMNIISAPKVGKSWLVTDLALSMATGRKWLDTFATEPGKVLIVDNELHGETSAHRIPKVADARYIALNDYGDKVHIANLRGHAASILELDRVFKQFTPGELRVVIIDAFYRALPPNVNENDNAQIANVYSQIDQYAIRLGCAFVLVHHSSKGNQSGKSITDVGSGAGSQARATDTHLVLRPHEQDGAIVVDAAVRSWAPIEPRCLRWSFPIFDPVDDLDPTALRPERPRKPRAPKADPDLSAILAAPQWTAERFSVEIVGETPATKDMILARATDKSVGMTRRHAETLLDEAIASGNVLKEIPGGRSKHTYRQAMEDSFEITQFTK